MYLYNDAASQIDTRLALSTNLRRFNPLDHSTSTYTPNASFWLAGVNITGSSPYCTGASNSKQSCHLIGRRHAVTCYHFASAGTVRMIKADGTVVSKAIARYAWITNDDVVHTGTSLSGTRKHDICIVEFDTDWDADIAAYPFVSSDIANFLPDDIATARRVPVLAFNRSDTNSLDINVGVSELASIAAVNATVPLMTCQAPVETNRLAAYSAYTAEDQDSTGALMLLLNGGVHYLFLTRSIGAGSGDGGVIAPTDIGRMYTALSATGDAPVVVALSSLYSAVPKGLAVVISSPDATLSWTIGSGTQTGIEVQIATDFGFTSPTTVSLAGNATGYVYTATVSGSYYFRVRSIDGSGSSAWTSIVTKNIAITSGGAEGTFYIRPIASSNNTGFGAYPAGAELHRIVGRAYNYPLDFVTDTDETGDTISTNYTQYDGGGAAGAVTLTMSTDTVPNDVTLLDARIEILSYLINNLTLGATSVSCHYTLYDSSDNVLVAKTPIATVEPGGAYNGNPTEWLLIPLSGITLTQLRGSKIKLECDALETDNYFGVVAVNICVNVQYPNLEGPYTVAFRNPTIHHWVAPARIDLTQDVVCELVGAGGSGGASTNGEAGGAGGHFVRKEIKANITASTDYSIDVGRVYIRNANGTDSTFGSTIVIAAGGNKGAGSTGGAAKSSASSTGDLIKIGGAGGNGVFGANAGGGGGGAGTESADGVAGTNAVTTTPGVGGASGGGNGGGVASNGQTASAIGGGGGGGGGSGGNAGLGGLGYGSLTYYLTTSKGFKNRRIRSVLFASNSQRK